MSLRRAVTNPCRTKVVDECPYDEESGLHCCKLYNCRICVTQYCENGDVHSDSSLFSEAELAYVAEINDSEVRVYWERLNGECELVVEVDGDEEGRWPLCPGPGEYGQECDDIDLTIPYVTTGGSANECTGTLEIVTYGAKRLRRDRSQGCARGYCADEECTCPTLCATMYRASRAIWDDCYTEASLEWDGEGPCELGWALARWSGSLTCGGDTYDAIATLTNREVSGERECLMTLELSNYQTGEEYELEEVVNDIHTGMRVVFEIDNGEPYSTFEVILECLVCGGCGPGVDQIACCDFAQIGTTEPDPVVVDFCGVSQELTNLPGAQWSGNYDPGDGINTIDINFGCLESGDDFYQDPDVRQYYLDLNCNSTGPNPVRAYADFISCDPFLVIFEINFECPGSVCDGEAQPIQVIVTGETEPLP